MECLEDTHAGRKHWGLVLYGIKSKLLAYYRLGSKNPTTYLNLDNLGNFKADDGIPIMITTDSDGRSYFSHVEIRVCLVRPRDLNIVPTHSNGPWMRLQHIYDYMPLASLSMSQKFTYS